MTTIIRKIAVRRYHVSRLSDNGKPVPKAIVKTKNQALALAEWYAQQYGQIQTRAYHQPA